MGSSDFDRVEQWSKCVAVIAAVINFQVTVNFIECIPNVSVVVHESHELADRLQLTEPFPHSLSK